MGPSDSYLVQHGRDTAPFWADARALRLGHSFRSAAASTSPPPPRRLLPPAQFSSRVAEGFQCGPTWQQGRLVGDGCGAAGGGGRAGAATSAGEGPPSGVAACAWAYSVTPVAGWGAGREGATSGHGSGEVPQQRSTASWLSALPLFDPHWQVLCAHGLASGTVTWGDRTYSFRDAPFYAEKNWGGQFPVKWWWAQCNAFPSVPGLAVTTAGGVRALLGGALSEEVALIGIHLPPRGRGGGDGRAAAATTATQFLEFVPWGPSSAISWSVLPWGRWAVCAVNATHEAQLVAACGASDGTPLRAPTADRGLAAVCRDTFAGAATLCVWERGPGGGRGRLVVRADSEQAALETGGRGWGRGRWDGAARMAPPLAAAAALPLDVAAVARAMGAPLPPGL